MKKVKKFLLASFASGVAGFIWLRLFPPAPDKK